tara:strand:- start:710 stop:976 length:267 start_codon:yes stop_codon:yes gene_type:complete
MDIKKRTLTALEESVLMHDLLDANEWAVGALDGKINNIKKRMLEEARKVLYADESVTQIPASDDEIITTYVARDDYKNRAERDAESTP